MKLSFKDIKARLAPEKTTDPQEPPGPEHPFPFTCLPSAETPINRDDYQIADGLYLISDYITREFEDALLEQGVNANYNARRWNIVRGRRV
jgi:hypothetical protein